MEEKERRKVSSPAESMRWPERANHEELLRHCYETVEEEYFFTPQRFKKYLSSLLNTTISASNQSTGSLFIEKLTTSLDLVEIILYAETSTKSKIFYQSLLQLTSLRKQIAGALGLLSTLKQGTKQLQIVQTDVPLKTLNRFRRLKNLQRTRKLLHSIQSFMSAIDLAERLLKSASYSDGKTVSEEVTQMSLPAWLEALEVCSHLDNQLVLLKQQQFHLERLSALKGSLRKFKDVNKTVKLNIRKLVVQAAVSGSLQVVRDHQLLEVLMRVKHLHKGSELDLAIDDYQDAATKQLKASISECVKQASQFTENSTGDEMKNKEGGERVKEVEEENEGGMSIYAKTKLLKLSGDTMEVHLQRVFALKKLLFSVLQLPESTKKKAEKAVEGVTRFVESSASQLLRSLCHSQLQQSNGILRREKTASFFRACVAFVASVTSMNETESPLPRNLLRTEFEAEVLRWVEKVVDDYIGAVEHCLRWEQWRQAEIPAFMQYLVSHLQEVTEGRALPEFVAHAMDSIEQLLPGKVPNAILEVHRAQTRTAAGSKAGTAHHVRKELVLEEEHFKCTGSLLMFLFVVVKLAVLSIHLRSLQPCISVGSEKLLQGLEELCTRYMETSHAMILKAKACKPPANLKRINTKNLALCAVALSVPTLVLPSVFTLLVGTSTEEQSKDKVAALLEAFNSQRLLVFKKLAEMVDHLLSVCLKVEYSSQEVRFVLDGERVAKGVHSMHSVLQKILPPKQVTTVFRYIFSVVSDRITAFLRELLSSFSAVEKEHCLEKATGRSTLRIEVNQLLSSFRTLPLQQGLSYVNEQGTSESVSEILEGIEDALHDTLETAVKYQNQKLPHASAMDDARGRITQVKTVLDELIEQVASRQNDKG